MKIFLLLLLGLSSPLAQANIGEFFGLGSRSAALGGATAAWGSDGFSAYANPAALSLMGENRRLSLSIGTLAMFPNFLPISGIVTENAYVSDLALAQTTVGDLPNDYRSSAGTVIGLAYKFAPGFLDSTIGMTAYLPFDAVAYMDTGETFLPEYALYRARLQRPQIDAALSGKIVEGLRFGLGAHVGFSLSANAMVFLKTTVGQPSSMRFAASLRPKIAPYGALLYSSDNDPHSHRAGSFSLGSIIRGPLASTNQMVMRANAQLFSNAASLGFNFTAHSALYYDPLSIELGGSVQYTEITRIFAQLDWQAWGAFESPALVIGDDVTIENCAGSIAGCGVVLQPGRNPSAPTRNIFIPRIGHEFNLGPWAIRTGYSYRPSIFQGLPTGSGNLLDPPKHLFSVGVGYEIPKAFFAEIPMQIDAHLAWQQLETQQITKTPGDELNQGTDSTKVGAPGYQAGGKIWGGGISLSLAL